MNDLVVIQSAQGFCQYVLKCFPDEADRASGVVVGFDGRYNSKRFAELTTAVFLNANIPVYLYSEMVATPFIPFAISQKKCLAGVMVTASHNPKEDNGYKVYWQNGSQIISPHDKNIERSIEENLKYLESFFSYLKQSLIFRILFPDPLSVPGISTFYRPHHCSVIRMMNCANHTPEIF